MFGDSMKTPTQQSHTFASHTNQRTDQCLQKSVSAPPQKNFKIFFSLLLKKLKHPTHKQTDTYRHDNWTTEKEAHAHNSTFAIGGVSCSAESFVVAESFVLRIKFSGKNPAHRKSANRQTV
jgi:hypothetical protein